MNNLIRTIVFGFLLTGAGPVFAQQGSQEEAKMSAMYRAWPDRILIRWAPGNYLAWNEANRLGYTVERTTTQKWKTAPGKTWETLAVIKPLAPASWEKTATANDWAATVWQAIYGESFDVEINGGKMADIINKVNGQEQRFTYALMACNRDFKVACMAGVGLVDSSVVKNEKYIYRIIRNRLNVKQPADTVFVIASTADYKPLPKIYKPVVQFKDRQALVSWESKFYESTYPAYIVERAEAKGSFKVLPGPPYGDFNPRINGGITASDSIPNGKFFRYRVRGISYFGETGPPSDEVSGTAVESNKVNPQIKSYRFLPDGKVELKWDFPPENNPMIDHFLLEQSERADGPYIDFVKITDVAKRTETIRPTWFTNYFVIGAAGKDGNIAKSMPILVQTIDSVPPAPPTGITGAIDSLGIVKLKWKANAENDIAGYKVLRGNLKNEEFSVLNATPIPATTYIDTVGLHLLNPEVYYQVIAVDHVNNHSKPSEIFTVIKPDTVPPTAPVFANYEITGNCLKLSWQNSSSSDLKNTRLLRQTNDSGSSETLISWENQTLTAFTDSLKKGNSHFIYDLIASDKKGNQTHALRKLDIQVPVLALKNRITNFSGIARPEEQSILLKWEIQATGLSRINIYRGKGQALPTFYKALPAGPCSFSDSNVQLAEDYTYYLKAVFENGDFSTTPIITVKF